MTTKLACEILQEINVAKNVVAELRKHITNQSLKQILGNAMIPKGKWILPEGSPPYRPNQNQKDLTPTNLLYEAKKFDKFRDVKIKQSRREELFIKTLEDLCDEEAKILIAIKDQILQSIFPNITIEKVVEAGFFVLPHYPEDWVDPMIKWKEEQKTKKKK